MVADPVYDPEVAAGIVVSGTTTAALEPGGAGAWTCAAVASVVNPLKVTDHVDMDVVGSNV